MITKNLYRLKSSNQHTRCQDMTKLIFSTRQTAEIIGFGHNAVRDLVYAGILKTLPGRNIRIPLVQIEQFIANNTNVWNKK